MSVVKSRIMYIERKAESMNGPARIGRVTFSKSGRTVEYRGQKFQKAKGGYKWNHFDVETGDTIGSQGREKTAKTAYTQKALSPSKSTKTFARSTGPRFVAKTDPRRMLYWRRVHPFQ